MAGVFRMSEKCPVSNKTLNNHRNKQRNAAEVLENEVILEKVRTHFYGGQKNPYVSFYGFGRDFLVNGPQRISGCHGYQEIQEGCAVRLHELLCRKLSHEDARDVTEHHRGDGWCSLDETEKIIA